MNTRSPPEGAGRGPPDRRARSCRFQWSPCEPFHSRRHSLILVANRFANKSPRPVSNRGRLVTDDIRISVSSSPRGTSVIVTRLPKSFRVALNSISKQLRPGEVTSWIPREPSASFRAASHCSTLLARSSISWTGIYEESCTIPHAVPSTPAAIPQPTATGTAPVPAPISVQVVAAPPKIAIPPSI
jgi:hypothetical protein